MLFVVIIIPYVNELSSFLSYPWNLRCLFLVPVAVQK